MFYDRQGKRHHAGMLALTITSIALTVPFIIYAKDIACSMRAIAHRKHYHRH